MKYLLTVVVMAALLCSTVGCASVRQTAETTETDPTSGVVKRTHATSSIVAAGDAKNMVEKARASAGKTASVGASGVSEETSSSGIAEMLKVLFQTAFEAGKKSSAP